MSPSAARPVNWIGLSLCVVTFLLVLTGGVLYWNNLSHGRRVLPRPASTLTVTKRSSSRPARAADQKEEESTSESSKGTAPATVPKSIDDL